MISWRSARSRSPFRSKRARTSPVSPRSNASGLTRTRVREVAATKAEGYRRRPRQPQDAVAGLGRSSPGDSRLAGGLELERPAPGLRCIAADDWREPEEALRDAPVG